MRWVKMGNLKKGQIVVEGKLGVGKFTVAELSDITFNFVKCKKFDMKKGIIIEEGKGVVIFEEIVNGINSLNKEEIKKVKMIENKMKMLDNLKDSGQVIELGDEK